MKFEVIYYKQPHRTDPVTESHRYTEEWNQSFAYCVNCGKQGVWVSEDEHLEAGPTHMCTSCGFSYTINYIYQAQEHTGMINNQEWQRLCALRAPNPDSPGKS